MNRCLRTAGSVVLVILSVPRAWAQDSVPLAVPAVRISSTPATVTEGTIGWLELQTDSGAKVVGGEAGGEALHLQRTPDGRYRGLVGVPVEVGDSFRISIRLQREAGTDTVATSLPVRPAAYPSEVLTVPPAFVKPDSISALRIQSEIAKSREVSRRSHERHRLWRGRFVLPRPSRITSRFGTARVYNGEVQSRHMGTDFAGAVGAPVRAAGRGVVALVADFYLAGRAIYIDHGAGLVTGYFHLSKAEVRQGQLVNRGQRIGLVGSSGRVTGPHLHWVARYGTISVDPLSLLALDSTPADHDEKSADLGSRANQ
jgi:murein DD-endopeptidase MepM/ murein hydrolase activator NlpD